MRPRVISILAMICALGFSTFAGCGGGSGNASPAPTISIASPTSSSNYSTIGSGVTLGGALSNASAVHVHNSLTGATVEGVIDLFTGPTTWSAQVNALGPGDNPLTATADEGPGTSAARAFITITRPLRPEALIINAPDQASATTFWTDQSSFGAHKVALFGDGTGRSTTGSTITGNPGPVVSFTWSTPTPGSIVIGGCPTCSFQDISRIEGSFSSSAFLGQVDTVGGGQITLDSFVLTSGTL